MQKAGPLFLSISAVTEDEDKMPREW